MKRLGMMLPLLMMGITLWVGYDFVDHHGDRPSDVNDSINWVSIEEAYKRAQQDDKKILVDVYTDWCGWCKVMDKQTYGDTDIATYINENFHAVKLDAEQEAPITLGGETYNFIAKGRKGYNEFAVKLLNGRLSFPSTAFLSPELESLGVAPGFIKPPQFSQLLSFINEEAYQSQSFQEYVKSQSR